MLLGPIKAMESVRTATPLKIRTIGGGWYGSHLTVALLDAGHQVELHESADRLFSGASGGNPARLHKGFHYPRSRLTRAACLDHADAFMRRYGQLTRAIPINLYAVAATDSMVDFGTYRDTMSSSGVGFLNVEDPEIYGLRNVEGALLTAERHIVIDQARAYFAERLAGVVHFGREAGPLDDPAWDLTLDCTFSALDAEAIDRYEPCLTVLVEGPTHQGLTVMDGMFPSLIPYDEDQGLCSLTSALYTPLSKSCRTWAEARQMLRDVTSDDLADRACAMFDQIAHFWPAARDLFRIVDLKTSIRAMPRSGADARLVDVVQVGERALRVRAGKIDAVFRAEALIMERIAHG